jgi:subtilisin family serine protease
MPRKSRVQVGLPRVCAALVFAAFFATAPSSAWAQSAAGCADASRANDPACVAQDSASGTVYLPPLISDLFRSTPANSGNADAPPVKTGPLPAPIAVNGNFVPDEVIVIVEGDDAAARRIGAELGLQVRSSRTSFLLGTSVVRYGIPDGRPVGTVLAQLLQNGGVTDAGANHVYTLDQAQPVDFTFKQIAFDASMASGAGMRIAIIDTARDREHPALANIDAEDFDALPDVPVEDTNHGTSIVGLIAGQDAFRGFAPGAHILHARAFEKGESNTDAILKSIDWAAGQGAQIINMSFEGPRNRLLERYCNAAAKRGIILVAAAGNHGPNGPPVFPAAYAPVIAVTATDADNTRMEQANTGAYVGISAPGVGIMAPIPGGGFDLVTGTSFAAAIYTGALASMMRRAPGSTGAEIEKRIATSALDLGAKGRDAEFGFGLMDVRAAMAAK